MKGALGLLTIAATIWIFWMTYEWLRKEHPNNKKRKK